MFRPYLYRGEDPALLAAKEAAFGVLYATARASLSAGRSEPVTEDQVSSLALAGWSLSHGFATLALTLNIVDLRDADPSAVAESIKQGVIALGKLAARQSD